MSDNKISFPLAVGGTPEAAAPPILTAKRRSGEQIE